MADYICEKFQEVIDLLNQTFENCDQAEIVELIKEAIQILEDLYAPIKDDLYYAHLICKELYCDLRDCREKAIELLGGVEDSCCVDACCEVDCPKEYLSTGALQALEDKGGCCELGEADALIREAIEIGRASCRERVLNLV